MSSLIFPNRYQVMHYSFWCDTRTAPNFLRVILCDSRTTSGTLDFSCYSAMYNLPNLSLPIAVQYIQISMSLKLRCPLSYQPSSFGHCFLKELKDRFLIKDYVSILQIIWSHGFECLAWKDNVLFDFFISEYSNCETF